jgi:hypothetical protein
VCQGVILLLNIIGHQKLWKKIITLFASIEAQINMCFVMDIFLFVLRDSLKVLISMGYHFKL